MRWRWPLLRFRSEDGDRYSLWPIRIGLVPKDPYGGRCYGFGWHGWETHCEVVPLEKTSKRCMPCLRSVFGQTLHLGFFQIRLGKFRR